MGMMAERPRWIASWLSYGSLIFLLAFLLIKKSSVVDSFFYAGILAPALFSLRWQDLRRFHSEPLVNAFFLMLAYLAISSFWSTEPDFQRYLKRWLYLYGLGFACYLLILRHEQREMWFMRWAALLMTSSVVAAALYFYLYRGHEFPATRLMGIGRLHSPIYMPAAVLAFTMAAMLDWTQLSKAWRHTLLACLVVGCAMIYLCQSRSALVALVGILIVFMAFSMRRQAALLGFVLLVIVGLALVFSPELLMERGTSFRTVIWSGVLEKFTHCNWLIGCGIGSDSGVISEAGRFPHQHSVYLGWLFYSGVIGLLGYLAVVAALLFRLHRQGEYSWMLILSMGLGITFTTADHMIITPNHNWLLLNLPFAFALAKLAVVRERPLTRATQAPVPAPIQPGVLTPE